MAPRDYASELDLEKVLSNVARSFGRQKVCDCASGSEPADHIHESLLASFSCDLAGMKVTCLQKVHRFGSFGYTLLSLRSRSPISWATRAFKLGERVSLQDRTIGMVLALAW